MINLKGVMTGRSYQIIFTNKGYVVVDPYSASNLENMVIYKNHAESVQAIEMIDKAAHAKMAKDSV